MIKGVAALNTPLIGKAGSRTQLETPAMLLDAKVFEQNVAVLADLSKKYGVALRPHAKSHKCANIAKRQIEAGALGLCCAKPGELLALFEAGIKQLMLSAPVSSPRKIEHLAQAAAAGCELIVVVDREDLITAYGAAARKAGTKISVLVDCDVGLGRTGATTPHHVVELASAISKEEGLIYAGIQAYSGQVQHVFDMESRRQINLAANNRIMEMIMALRDAKLAPKIISGGGTGSHLIDFEDRIFTEVQAGSYVFMDEGYLPVDIHGTGAGEKVFGMSLFVVVTVIGHSAGNGQAITDGGTKSFAIDGPPPRAFLKGKEIGTILWAGDEFGRIKTHPGIPAPPAGTRIECTIPHCDPTANLHSVLHVVRGDTLEAIWPVEARGYSD